MVQVVEGSRRQVVGEAVGGQVVERVVQGRRSGGKVLEGGSGEQELWGAVSREDSGGQAVGGVNHLNLCPLPHPTCFLCLPPDSSVSVALDKWWRVWGCSERNRGLGNEAQGCRGVAGGV